MSSLPRALLLAALALLTASCVDRAGDTLLAPESPAATVVAGEGIKVMSQNLYLGANIDLLLTADSPDDIALVFQQLGTSTLAGDFGRARQIALQIALEAPHLVGLQEVTTYQLGPLTLDFLYVLQAYLDGLHAVLGTPAYTAVRHDNTTVVFNASAFGPFPDVTYTDGDAILVRSDVAVIGAPTLKKYDHFEIFSVAGTSFANRRGYLAVTAQVGDRVIRFGNTHLEVQLFEDTQLLQAAELIEAFADEDLPVVLVGDFNSAGNHDAAEDQMSGTYHMLRNAGYADLWLRQPHSVSGYTCCQGADLTNVASQLGQRLDLVLVRYGNAGFGGKSTMEVLGDEPADRISIPDGPTLWPSDHAAVAARFWPAPGRSRTW